jgi:hypothetical protein
VEGTAIFIKNGTVKDTGLYSASTATADSSSSSSATTTSTSTTSSPFFGMVYYAIVDASDIKVRWRKEFEVLICTFKHAPLFFELKSLQFTSISKPSSFSYFFFSSSPCI